MPLHEEPGPVRMLLQHHTGGGQAVRFRSLRFCFVPPGHVSTATRSPGSEEMQQKRTPPKIGRSPRLTRPDRRQNKVGECLPGSNRQTLPAVTTQLGPILGQRSQNSLLTASDRWIPPSVTTERAAAGVRGFGNKGNLQREASHRCCSRRSDSTRSCASDGPRKSKKRNLTHFDSAIR